jgi:gliding motility-associated-like protein
MKRKIFLFWLNTIIVLLNNTIICNGQGWILSNKITGSLIEPKYSVIDDFDNHYFLAPFFDTIYSPINLISTGNRDLALIKINKNGNVLWFHKIGSTDAEVAGGITKDNQNNIYVTGTFRKTCYFTASDSLVSTGNGDIFLAKYNQNGIFQWAKRIGSAATLQASSDIIFDGNTSLILCGYYNDSLIFGYDPANMDTLLGNAFTTNFAAGLDLNGNPLWINRFLGSNNLSRFLKIRIIQDGYYFGGYFQGNLYFDIDTIISYSSNNYDAFIYKTDFNGLSQWIRKIQGLNNENFRTLATDEYQNVYVLGNYNSNTLYVDSTETKVSTYTRPASSNYDTYICKYNRSGNLQWFLRIGGTGKDIYNDFVVRNNIIYATGYFANELIFNNDTLRTSSALNEDAFLAAFNQIGNPIAGVSIVGTGNYQDAGTIVNMDANSRAYVSGYYRSQQIVIGDSVYTSNNVNKSDLFFAIYEHPFTAVITSVQAVSCNGLSDGILQVTPYFGRPPYKYIWSHNPSLNQPIASNLTAGTYTVTIVDADNDSAKTTGIVPQPPPLNITANITNISCYNYNNGAIDITVTGGTKTTDYAYNWTSLDGSGLHPLQADQTGLSRGTYYITVKDDNLCSLSDTFIVTQPDPINFSGTIVTNIVNPPGGNGAINLTVGGGTSPYTYAWAGPSGYSSTNEDIVNLNGGLYYITVTDSRSCQGDSSFVVNDAGILIAQLTDKTDVTCYGLDDGTATITVYNATLPVSYSWSDGANFNNVYDTIHLRTALRPGLNSVTVTDAAAKTAVVNLQIDQPSSALTAVLVPTHLRCNGDNSGAVDCIVSGGTLPFQFSWNTGYTGEDLVNIASGTYIVTVTDANGCQDNQNTVINQPSAISLTVDQVGTINCHGDQTGSAIANASGGTGTFSYLWNDPGAQITKTATNLFAGNYQVRVTDENGCYRTGSVLIQEPGIININATITPVKCYNGADGSILTNVTGGTPPFFFIWSNGVFGTGIIGISNLTAGDYSLLLTDANNCQVSDTFLITRPDSLYIISITPTNLTCYNAGDGAIAIDATGGTGQLSYSANNGSSYQTGNEITGLDAGNYQVLVRDANNCTTSPENVTLTQPAAIDIVTQEATDISCYGANDGAITIIASEGAGGFEYSIDGGATYSTIGQFTGLSPATYEVRVRDAMNCEASGNNLSVNEPDVLTIDTTNVEHITDRSPRGSITLSSSGGTTPVTFILLPDSTLSTSGLFSALDTGLYKVRAVDNNNCPSNELNIRILMFASGKLIIYDAFSPFTTPGKNDTWTIGNIEHFPNCTVKIFNAWGNQVFSSKGYSEPWDGTYNNKKLPSGTYYYVIDLGDGSDIITGSVNIVY